MDSLPSMLKKIGDNHFRENSGLCYEDFIVGSTIDSDHGRTITEADLLISIAHPDFRDQLKEQAKEMSILV